MDNTSPRARVIVVEQSEMDNTSPRRMSAVQKVRKLSDRVMKDFGHAHPANGGRIDAYIEHPETADLDAVAEPEECSKKEEWGWYSYDFANSVYSSIVISLMGPLLVNGLATKKIYGNIAGCTSTELTPGFNGSKMSTMQNYRYDRDFEDLVYPATCDEFNRVQNGSVAPNPEGFSPNVCTMCFAERGVLLYDCRVNGTYTDRWSEITGTVDFGPFKTRAFTFTTLVISLSVIVQAILFIAVGPCADFGSNRKNFLMVFACIGIAASFGLFFVFDKDRYDVGGLLLVLSNVCFGLTIVFYNAYLPLLVDAHPEVRQEIREAQAEGADDIADRLHEKRRLVARRMSDWGFAIGYAAGLFMYLVCIPIVLYVESGTGFRESLGARICIFIAAAWWLVFSIPTFLYLLPRSGPDFPKSVCCGDHPARVLIIGGESLVMTLMHARKYKQTLLFLICYFIYSDSYGTMVSVGFLFGADALCMDQASLVACALIVTVCAIAGVFLYQYIDKCQCCKVGSKGIIIINLAVYLFMSIYACMGFVDAVPFGLKMQEEMYVFCAVFGLHIGSIQSFTRTTFGKMIPPGKENQFFALYEISDKGSSWLGPLIVGFLYHQTGQIRASFVYLVISLLVPIIMLLFCVNVKEGIEAAGKADLLINAHKSGPEGTELIKKDSDGDQVLSELPPVPEEEQEAGGPEPGTELIKKDSDGDQVLSASAEPPVPEEEQEAACPEPVQEDD